MGLNALSLDMVYSYSPETGGLKWCLAALVLFKEKSFQVAQNHPILRYPLALPTNFFAIFPYSQNFDLHVPKPCFSFQIPFVNNHLKLIKSYRSAIIMIHSLIDKLLHISRPHIKTVLTLSVISFNLLAIVRLIQIPRILNL